MAITVESVMRECRNFFETAHYDGEFAITGGVVALPEELPDGTYIAISGSAFHDGVHKIGDAMDVPDETFSGRVYILHPPKSFLEICEEINEYDQKNPVGAFQSESFGEYQYTRAGVQTGLKSWQSAMQQRLNPYRKMFTEVL